MRKVLLLVASLTLVLSACKENKEAKIEEVVEAVQEEVAPYDVKGVEFEDTALLSSSELLATYKSLKVGDTLDVKVKAKVNSVCQKKGCWMRLDLGEQESFVKFQDYGFFMPKDLAGTEVLVNGKVYVEETSVEDLKHYALDGGKSQEEIDAILAPELSYNFMSTGVLIPKEQVE